MENKKEKRKGVIFTRARVSLALLSLRKNGGLLVVFFLLRKLQRKRENKTKGRFHIQSNNSGHSSLKVVGHRVVF